MTSKKDMMTIKELADSLNMPKNKINYQVSKLDTKYIVVLNGIKHLTKQGQKLILVSLGIDKPFNSSDQLNTDSDDFKHLIKQQEEQLKSKDSQIEKLHTLLDQQQQLTLQSNKQIEKLQIQLGTTIKENTEESKNEEPHQSTTNFSNKRRTRTKEPRERKTKTRNIRTKRIS